MNRTGWVYVGNARGGDGGFILPNGGVKRIELPVKVGRAYRVAINEIQCPNTAARSLRNRPMPSTPIRGVLRIKSGSDSSCAACAVWYASYLSHTPLLLLGSDKALADFEQDCKYGKRNEQL